MHSAKYRYGTVAVNDLCRAFVLQATLIFRRAELYLGYVRPQVTGDPKRAPYNRVRAGN